MRGLVIGKFYPLHKGHSYLINYAAARVDTLDVLVCDHPSYHIAAATRKTWIETLHPKVTVHIIPDIEKDDDSLAWAKHTVKFLGYAPDIVFSSEDYGFDYAKFMGAKHHQVDKAREAVPICGTDIRGDVLGNWQYLAPVVRANYTQRVCVIGAESTGTTTLAKKLAETYHTPWVPEYGRYYTEALNDRQHEWSSQEFTHIAQIQHDMENQLAGETTNGLVICDTNAFATRLWHKRYMDSWSEDVDAIAAEDKVDLYILTGDEIPFEQDGTRDGEHIRHDMQQDFIRQLILTDIPFIEVHGSVEQRLASCRGAIDSLLRNKVTI